MPIYNYECSRCGYRVELIRKIDDRHTGPTCVENGDDHGPMVLVVSQISRPRFIGDGFHQNDYPNMKRPWDTMPDHPPDNMAGMDPINKE